LAQGKERKPGCNWYLTKPRGTSHRAFERNCEFVLQVKVPRPSSGEMPFYNKLPVKSTKSENDQLALSVRY
jgi:hypothetical protein